MHTPLILDLFLSLVVPTHSYAAVVQVCSAVQNQDSTVITDYISGLQTLVRVTSGDGDKNHQL